MVSLNPYRLVFGETLYLKGTHSRDAVLFVLPSSSSSEEARQILDAVSDSALPMNAKTLRQLARQCAAGVGYPADGQQGSSLTHCATTG